MGLYGNQAADPSWGVKIRTWHYKPTADGGQRLEKSIPKKPFQEASFFLRQGQARRRVWGLHQLPARRISRRQGNRGHDVGG